MKYQQQVIDHAKQLLADYRWGSDDFGRNVHMVAQMPNEEFMECVMDVLNTIDRVLRENDGRLDPSFIYDELPYEIDERTWIALAGGCEDALYDLVSIM